MGKVMKELARGVLPEREAHHSRILVDLSENVHLHHRDWRLEFSVDEFFEFAAAVQQSARELRAYFAAHPEYREQQVFDTIFIAGGDERLFGLLENSPAPNTPAYWSSRAVIELLDPTMRDEMHVHIRDHRFAMPRSAFRELARVFREAESELDAWEAKNRYPMRLERTRTMRAERQRVQGKAKKCGIVEHLPVDEIGYREPDHTRDLAWQAQLAEAIDRGEEVFPILVSTEKDGSHRVIDGEHRLAATKAAGEKTIPCVIAPLTFGESKRFRAIEGELKQLDRKTKWRYNLTGLNREFLAYRLSRHYQGKRGRR